MIFAQKYALVNREIMIERILMYYNLEFNLEKKIESIHNYHLLLCYGGTTRRAETRRSHRRAAKEDPRARRSEPDTPQLKPRVARRAGGAE